MRNLNEGKESIPKKDEEGIQISEEANPEIKNDDKMANLNQEVKSAEIDETHAKIKTDGSTSNLKVLAKSGEVFSILFNSEYFEIAKLAKDGYDIKISFNWDDEVMK
jgi:hypothetical protein